MFAPQFLFCCFFLCFIVCVGLARYSMHRIVCLIAPFAIANSARALLLYIEQMYEKDSSWQNNYIVFQRNLLFAPPKKIYFSTKASYLVV